MKTLFTWRRTLLGLVAAGVIGQCLAFSFGAAPGKQGFHEADS